MKISYTDALLVFLHDSLGHQKACTVLGIVDRPDPQAWCWRCRGEELPEDLRSHSHAEEKK